MAMGTWVRHSSGTMDWVSHFDFSLLAGPRLVTLLHDHIQQLRCDLSAGVPTHRLGAVSALIHETFALLSECAKDRTVEATLYNKMFQQLYVTCLVALAAPRPLHASLAPLQPYAAALLNAVKDAT